MGKKQELDKAAKKLADAYRAWIMANAEYNSLLASFSGGEFSYTLKWVNKQRTKKRP